MSLRRRILRRFKRAHWNVLRATRRVVTLQTQQGRLAVYTRDDIIARMLFMDGHYQRDLTERALSFLRARGLVPHRGAGIILDIGANIGNISIGLLVDGEMTGAIGIEPEPANFELLERNVAANGLRGRFVTRRLAASDRTGHLRFGLNPVNFGDHRVQSGEASNGRLTITVPARPIDEVMTELAPEMVRDLAIVWIDVQGHEGQVFKGGRSSSRVISPLSVKSGPKAFSRQGSRLKSSPRSLNASGDPCGSGEPLDGS